MGTKRKTALTEHAQGLIVQSLACFDPPSVVAEAIRKEFGVTISRQAVEAYDPSKRAGRRLAEKWRTLFDSARKAFLDDATRIAISHRVVRLRALDRMYGQAESRGNFALAAALLKQAAEEMGNAYTNRRELTGKDGKDLPMTPAVLHVVIEGQPMASAVSNNGD